MMIYYFLYPTGRGLHGLLFRHGHVQLDDDPLHRRLLDFRKVKDTKEEVGPVSFCTHQMQILLSNSQLINSALDRRFLMQRRLTLKVHFGITRTIASHIHYSF